MYDYVIHPVPDNLPMRQLLDEAAWNGHIYLLNYILQKGVSPVAKLIPSHRDRDRIDHTLGRIIEEEHLDVLKIFLADPRVAALADYPNMLDDAIIAKNVEMTRYLLSITPVRVDINKNLLPLAVEGDDIKMVKLLLSQRPIPYEDNAGLEAAVQMGHVDIVDLFLQDPGFQPHLYYYLSRAAVWNQVATVQKLLSMTDPSPYDNDILKDAIRHKYLDIVRILLDDPRVKPEAIEDADDSLHDFLVENSDAETTQLMRQDGRLPARFFI